MDNIKILYNIGYVCLGIFIGWVIGMFEMKNRVLKHFILTKKDI